MTQTLKEIQVLKTKTNYIHFGKVKDNHSNKVK